jgi:hypothetical protein
MPLGITAHVSTALSTRNALARCPGHRPDRAADRFDGFLMRRLSMKALGARSRTDDRCAGGGLRRICTATGRWRKWLKQRAAPALARRAALGARLRPIASLNRCLRR